MTDHDVHEPKIGQLWFYEKDEQVTFDIVIGIERHKDGLTIVQTHDVFVGEGYASLERRAEDFYSSCQKSGNYTLLEDID